MTLIVQYKNMLYEHYSNSYGVTIFMVTSNAKQQHVVK